MKITFNLTLDRKSIFIFNTAILNKYQNLKHLIFNKAINFNKNKELSIKEFSINSLQPLH